MKISKLIIFLIIFIYLIVCAYGADGPGGPSGNNAGSSGSSSGGKHIVKLNLDDMVENAKKWKQQDPDKFDEFKELLHIPFIPPNEYKTPTVFIYYPENETEISRNDKLTIYASIANDNPAEVRSDLYLWLEVKKPNSNNFTRIDSQRVVLTNEYNERNASSRCWSCTPFDDSGEIGNVSFRIGFNDMHHTYYTDTMYSKRYPDGYHKGNFHNELELELINFPPELDDGNMKVSPSLARYNDPIKYQVQVVDADEDLINVTLHVIDDQGREHDNATQMVKSGTNLTFIANEYGFFAEDDSGKNFSYYYSYDDGVASKTSTNKTGPQLLSSPKIWVSNPTAVPEDKNNYWWQNYRFHLKVKNPDMDNLTIELYTNTPNHPEKFQKSTTIDASEELKEVSFDVKPFDVSDADHNFSYYFKYSAPDQDSRYYTPFVFGGAINPKIIKYPMSSPIIWINVVIPLLIVLMAGILIERRFYR